jgi:hypothetical protein
MGAPACLSRWQACGTERCRVPQGIVAYVAQGVTKPRTRRAAAKGFAAITSEPSR